MSYSKEIENNYPEVATPKQYLGKPQLYIKRYPQFVTFRCHCGKKYYAQMDYLYPLMFKRLPFIYANEFVPFKTMKDLKQNKKEE